MVMDREFRIGIVPPLTASSDVRHVRQANNSARPLTLMSSNIELIAPTSLKTAYDACQLST
jgi:hypothetical protein